MTPEIIEQAIEQMRRRAMLLSPDTEAHGIGTMTRERWRQFSTPCQRMASMTRHWTGSRRFPTICQADTSVASG